MRSTSCFSRGYCRVNFLSTLCVIILYGTLAILPAQANQALRVGAEQFSAYLPMLESQRVGLIVNHTAMTPQGHLVDVLLDANVDVRKVFAPEHGFRGSKGAGEAITNNTDPNTGLPIISLYGKTKKPTPSMLADIDILVFDIQDVGSRFYTYISTMHYAMEAAAENNVAFLVLDRPNPNGQHIAGPVLDLTFQSFVGMHPIPILHGLTVGELARMIKGEQWIKRAEALSLNVIPVAHYHKDMPYELPIAPSPNLPNANAIRWYASLCLFEPTLISIGRGTELPFQMLGHPHLPTNFFAPQQRQVTPKSVTAAPYPKWENTKVVSVLMQDIEVHSQPINGFDIRLLLRLHSSYADNFFTSPAFFDKLAGTDSLRKGLERGLSQAQFEQMWQADIKQYKHTAKPYLLYTSQAWGTSQ